MGYEGYQATEQGHSVQYNCQCTGSFAITTTHTSVDEVRLKETAESLNERRFQLTLPTRLVNQHYEQQDAHLLPRRYW